MPATGEQRDYAGNGERSVRAAAGDPHACERARPGEFPGSPVVSLCDGLA